MKPLGPIRIVVLLLFLTPGLGRVTQAAEQPPVQGQLQQKTAWVGERVLLVITLYSPGPFEGTPAFDLPELPGTVFVKLGSPVVGSEEIDGDSFITQRHEFAIFTQRSGQITIPPFRVRFSGKQSFTSDAVPVAGFTGKLQFSSRRPPGTENLGIVVTAESMQIEQTWNPRVDSPLELRAGDVIERLIARTAAGTTGMLMSPVPADAPAGVQVYRGSVRVRDKTQRGQNEAERNETVRYQFQNAGTFTVPDLEFVWWDAKQEQLRRQTLPGTTVNVMEVAVSESPGEEDVASASSSAFPVTLGCLLLLTLVAWYFRQHIRRGIAGCRAYYNRPELRTVRELRRACKTNHPRAAYTAMLEWFAAQPHRENCESLEALLATANDSELLDHWHALSRQLFAAGAAETAWNGATMWPAFQQFQRQLKHDPHPASTRVLPDLNPS